MSTQSRLTSFGGSAALRMRSEVLPNTRSVERQFDSSGAASWLARESRTDAGQQGAEQAGSRKGCISKDCAAIAGYVHLAPEHARSVGRPLQCPFSKMAKVVLARICGEGREGEENGTLLGLSFPTPAGR